MIHLNPNEWCWLVLSFMKTTASDLANFDCNIFFFYNCGSPGQLTRTSTNSMEPINSQVNPLVTLRD